MKQKKTKFELRFSRWVVRLIASGFFGIFFAAGCKAVYMGLTEPLNIEGATNLGIYEVAPFGLLFMTIGFIPLYYAFRPIVFWEDYLEPVSEKQ